MDNNQNNYQNFASFVQYCLPFNAKPFSKAEHKGAGWFSYDEELRAIETDEIPFGLPWRGELWTLPEEDYEQILEMYIEQLNQYSLGEEVDSLDNLFVISHLVISAKEGCRFEIVSLNFPESVEDAIDGPEWTISTGVYQIGISEQLEFQNVYILGIGIPPEDKENIDNINSVAYFGKNAMMEMTISPLTILLESNSETEENTDAFYITLND